MKIIETDVNDINYTSGDPVYDIIYKNLFEPCDKLRMELVDKYPEILFTDTVDGEVTIALGNKEYVVKNNTMKRM
ncbi:MAG: hypothetical protein ACP5N7_07110 [Candidatus Pacearchaeota archaeon]